MHSWTGDDLSSVRCFYAAWLKRNGASDCKVAALIGDKSEAMEKRYTRHVEAETSIGRAFKRLQDEQGLHQNCLTRRIFRLTFAFGARKS